MAESRRRPWLGGPALHHVPLAPPDGFGNPGGRAQPPRPVDGKRPARPGAGDLAVAPESQRRLQRQHAGLVQRLRRHGPSPVPGASRSRRGRDPGIGGGRSLARLEGGEGPVDLCCGYAGRAYALLELHGRTQDPVWLARARELADRAVRVAPQCRTAEHPRTACTKASWASPCSSRTSSSQRRRPCPCSARRIVPPPVSGDDAGSCAACSVPTMPFARRWTTPSCLTTADTFRLRRTTRGVGHPNVRFSRSAAHVR